MDNQNVNEGSSTANKYGKAVSGVIVKSTGAE
jgi:hypothetical protein